jgi:hypothetical protein
VLAGVDGGGFDAASPVGVFGVEDPQVDEGGVKCRCIATEGMSLLSQRQVPEMIL